MIGAFVPLPHDPVTPAKRSASRGRMGRGRAGIHLGCAAAGPGSALQTVRGDGAGGNAPQQSKTTNLAIRSRWQ